MSDGSNSTDLLPGLTSSTSCSPVYANTRRLSYDKPKLASVDLERVFELGIIRALHRVSK